MKVLLECYYLNNFGDDLILASFLQNSKYSEITILGDEKRRGNSKIFEFPIKFTSYKDALINVNQYDAFVVIGGSMFQEVTGWKRRILKLSVLTKAFKFFDKERYITGINYGPMFSNEFTRKTIKLFDDFNSITVRDRYSYDLIKEHSKAKVNIFPDAALAFEYKEVKQINTQNHVGINMINSPNIKDLESYVKKISELSNKLLEKGYKITYYSFQTEDSHNDQLINDLVIKNLSADNKINIKTISYDGKNHEDFFNSFSSCGLIIGARFHSIILGIMLKKKVLPIVYSEKTTEFLKTIKYKGDFDLLDLKDVRAWDVEGISKKIISLDPNSTKYKDDIDEFKKSSKNHFNYIR